MLPEYISDGPLFVVATVTVLGRRAVRWTRRIVLWTWNAAVTTFIIWPTDQAIKIFIWGIAKRDGLNASEKRAFATKIWAEARSNDPQGV